MRSYSTVLLHKNRYYTILGDLFQKYEQLATTRSEVREKSESADATRPVVAPHHKLCAVGKLAIWPPVHANMKQSVARVMFREKFTARGSTRWRLGCTHLFRTWGRVAL